MKEETGNRIILFSFVLTVFVIWLHAGECLISSIPGQIAVPGFFILSGFLFFRGIAPEESRLSQGCLTGQPPEPKNEQDPGTDRKAAGERKKVLFLPVRMREKLKRRARTLLVPYLLWNFLYFLICLILGKAEAGEIFSAVFLYRCNPVFWYLQQLILITLITPLLYAVMKRRFTAYVWLAVIFALAVLYGRIHSLIDIQFINEDALFYYSLGAVLSLHIYKGETAAGEEGTQRIRKAQKEAQKQDFTEVPEEAETAGAGTGENGRSRRHAPGFFSAWKKVLVTAGALLLFDLLSGILPDLLKNTGVIGLRASGAFLVWFMIERLPAVRTAPWMKITFFIYATHYAVIRLVWMLETAAGLNGSAAANIVTYLLMPAVCTAAAYGIYKIMKKYTPKLLGILTGDRGA